MRCRIQHHAAYNLLLLLQCPYGAHETDAEQQEDL